MPEENFSRDVFGRGKVFGKSCWVCLWDSQGYINLTSKFSGHPTIYNSEEIQGSICIHGIRELFLDSVVSETSQNSARQHGHIFEAQHRVPE